MSLLYHKNTRENHTIKGIFHTIFSFVLELLISHDPLEKKNTRAFIILGKFPASTRGAQSLDETENF